MAHTIAKAPALRADTERKDLYWLIEKLTVESIKVSARSGCRYIIIEPFLKNSPSMDFYLSFADIARENNITDCSMLPFSCVNRGVPGIDWSSLIRGLRAIDFDGELICDFRHSQSAVTHLLRQLL